MIDAPSMAANGVRFLPWIGERYAGGPRLLVLGESHYSREESPPSNLTQRVTRDFVDGKWTHRYWTQMARTIAGRQLAADECRELWRGLAFYNFVQHIVGQGPRARPTEAMWLSAGDPFLYVLSQLNPQAVLVTGKELWHHMPKGHGVVLARSDGTAWPGNVYENASRSVMTTYINHPASRGFSWRAWSDVVSALNQATSSTFGGR